MSFFIVLLMSNPLSLQTETTFYGVNSQPTFVSTHRSHPTLWTVVHWYFAQLWDITGNYPRQPRPWQPAAPASWKNGTLDKVFWNKSRLTFRKTRKIEEENKLPSGIFFVLIFFGLIFFGRIFSVWIFSDQTFSDKYLFMLFLQVAGCDRRYQVVVDMWQVAGGRLKNHHWLLND